MWTSSWFLSHGEPDSGVPSTWVFSGNADPEESGLHNDTDDINLLIDYCLQ